MRGSGRLWFLLSRTSAVAALLFGLADPALAIEGNTAAGPIGGSDIRSAVLPPPGFYAGAVGLASSVDDIKNGNGQTVPGLDAIHLTATIAAPFFIYVPDVRVFDGSIALFGVLPGGKECGQLVSFVPRRCISGFGDPYFELAWSRSFGQLRPSRYPGALPIMEGLTLGLGVGVVLPVGKYDAQTQAANGITIGNNTFDIAPSLAVTYTTPPILVEGTEFSAKLYWNNYRTNPTTHYTAGSLIDIDFAVSEHIGRFQVGVAGFYAFQIEDDRLFGVTVPPDGRQVRYMTLGGVLNYDLPEIGAILRFKALTTVIARNVVESQTFVVGFAKKLY
jgi:hypothetical protein